MRMIMKPTGPENTDQRHEDEEEKIEKRELMIWDCGSPLYDSYELVSLTHLIERHFMILPPPTYLGRSKRFIARFISGPTNVPIGDEGPTKVASTKWNRAASEKIKASTRIFGLCNKIVPWKKKC